MHTIRRVALLAALIMVVKASASTLAFAESGDLFSVGDCNSNGTPDAQESSWANRDDDGDGVCNAVDNCPDEPNADQSTVPDGTGAACQVQAITVPASPANLAAPHLSYSGLAVTLAGIARYGGNQFMWDYGDGSAPMPWSAISDPYNLGIQHVYTGSAGTQFTATLSVRNSIAPAVVATATYPLMLVTATDLSDAAQLILRTQMAVDRSLWYLHRQATRSLSADGAPGYRQPFGSWSSVVSGCAAVDAFEQHGSLPGGDRRTDPYVEDVRSGLNKILAGAGATAITVQAHGNPDGNANGIGVHLGGSSTSTRPVIDAVCALALIDSGASGRHAGTGSTNIYDRTYAAIAQDVADWFAWGQTDDFGGAEGGWGYVANDTSAQLNNTPWPILALSAARSKMAAFVPAFVAVEAAKFLLVTQSTALDNGNGAWGYNSSTDSYKTIATTAGGIAGSQYVGRPNTDARVRTGLGFVYRDWTGLPGYSSQDNLGDSFTMYLLATSLTSFGLRRVVEYDYVHGTQTANSFEWFFTPAGQTQTGYGTHLVSTQMFDGSWPATVGILGGDAGFPGDAAAVTAFDTVILQNSPGFCGDAVVQSSEQCDFGTANGTGAVCCNSSCNFKPGNAACDDGNVCTQTDRCESGICTGSNTVTCAASDQCHVAGTCSPATGTCSNPSAPNGTLCNDAIACTTNDACSNGLCAGTSLGAPPEVQNVIAAADKATYSWSATATATQYDVVRGSTGAFPIGPGGNDEACFANVTSTSITDSAIPAPLNGFWYLSRAESTCGIGSFGTRSNGSPRTTTTCP